LEADLASDEQNHEVRIKLAVQLSSHGQYREALEHLLVVLRADRDWGNGEAKRVYLDMIATIGKGDPLAAEYQRKLFSLLVLKRHAEKAAVRRAHVLTDTPRRDIRAVINTTGHERAMRRSGVAMGLQVPYIPS
jgi:hypothetical protein